MEIGIITLSASDNCGSLLQCYALKEILSKYGNVEVINFTSTQSDRIYRVFNVKKIYYTCRSLSGIKYFLSLCNDRKYYNRFRKKYIGIRNKKIYPENLKNKKKYDVVFVGSDQVWNVKMPDFDMSFFLSWYHGKKVAFSPSLGGHEINESENYEKIKELIKKFDFLSVREKKGKICLKKIVNKEVPILLDPTLMLNCEKWQKLVGKKLVKEKYIFYYSWAYCEDATKKIVIEHAEKAKLPIYVLDRRKIQLKNKFFHFVKKAGPSAMLNLMYYAETCYVESFHGVIFAYLFKKNFWLLDTNENFKNMDTRLKEIVELLGVEDRIITRFNKDMIDCTKQIDYKENKLIKERQEETDKYLREVFY